MTERASGRAARIIAEAAHDVTHTLRAWRNEPALFGGIVLTLALALGANASMFGVVSQLLFSPPPGVRSANDVYNVKIAGRTELGDEFEVGTTSFPVFDALRSVKALAGVAAVRAGTATVGTAAERTEVTTALASGEYFTVLGAVPALGRFFGPADDGLPQGSPVVVLSHAFWKRHFAGDPTVVGRELTIDDRPFRIIGVARPRFTGAALTPVDVFLPLNAGMYGGPSGWRSVLHMNVVSIVTRLRDAARSAAEQQATIAYAQLLAYDPDGSTRRIRLESLVPGAAARQTARGRIALWLSGVTLVVLITAAANVGTLLLLRAARRRRDISVRLALGVTRGRLLRQLLVETLVLALSGGVTGLVFSRWISDLIRTTLMVDLAATDTWLDGRVLLNTVLATTVVGLLAALSPMLLVARFNISNSLQAASTRATAVRSPLRTILVTVQVALTTILLAGAGLFVRSLQRVQSQDLGFSTSKLTYISLDFLQPVAGVESDRLHLAAKEQLLRTPGVVRASQVQATPFGSFHVPPIGVPGMEGPPNAGGQLPYLYAATPEYLLMMRVQLRAGRLITAADHRAAPLVVLVNETMAREVWPGQNALGKCIRLGFDPALPMTPVAPPTLPCRQVVGIVRDSRARSLRPVNREASLMQYYVPFEQVLPTRGPDGHQIFGLVVETERDPDDMVGTLQRVIQRTLTVPVYARVRPYQDLLDPQLRPWRLGATLFTTFGMLALALAAVGLFAVISYLANEQTRAIGVRLALGAAPAAMRRLVVLNALRLVITGVALGLITALLLGRFAQEMLFQTSPRDPLVLVGSSGALLAVTVIAAAVPALRAGRVSPLIAMRAE